MIKLARKSFTKNTIFDRAFVCLIRGQPGLAQLHSATGFLLPKLHHITFPTHQVLQSSTGMTMVQYFFNNERSSLSKQFLAARANLVFLQWLTENFLNPVPARLFCARGGGGGDYDPWQKPCSPSQNLFKESFPKSLSKVEPCDASLVSMETMVSVLR